MTHIPATYIGIQPGYGRHPSLLLYNLLMDIPGHPMGSTVSLQTLMREGFHPVEKGGISMWPDINEPPPSLWPPIVALLVLLIVGTLTIIMRG